MSVNPWSTALLVAIEATGQVLRGSEAPTPALPNLPTWLRRAVMSMWPEEPWRSSCPAVGGVGAEWATASCSAVSVWPGPRFSE